MIKKGPTTSVDSLDALISANANLRLKVGELLEELEHRDVVLAELQTRLNQYWDLHEDVDYRSLVTRIREEARNVGEELRGLDIGARRTLARLGTGGDSKNETSNVSGKRLLPRVHSLLRTLDEWK